MLQSTPACNRSMIQLIVNCENCATMQIAYQTLPVTQGLGCSCIMGHTMILYHQTSPENARKILRSQEMKPGSSWSYAGSGIYFATTPRATNRKARCKGVILSCKVDLGRVREIILPGDWSPGFWQFWLGYDSIKITSLNGVEYVVFDSRRVKSIRLYQGSCNDSWEELKKLGLGLGLYVGAWLAAPGPMLLVHGLAAAAKVMAE